MTEYSYEAVRVEQRQGAPAFYLIGAPAREITKWADAPHKKASLKAGYQRELKDTRLEAIKQFLEVSTMNLLPSAALIAVREEHFAINYDGDRARVIIKTSDKSEAELREDVLAELKQRLSGEELASVETLAKDDEDGDRENEEDEDDLGNDNIEEDELTPDSYMASLYLELSNFKSLKKSRREEMMEFVSSMTVPGLIMDGQHRIFGAKEVPEEIVLPVVLIPGLGVAEQVFNFYVLNNKAVPLDKRQLRSIISTSLTKGEIDNLYKRFAKSGLRADEAQWTYRVATDSGSPFKNLISLKLEGESAPIDDNVMDQVVSRFIKLPKTYSSLKDGVAWDSDDYSHRLALFYSMWSAVRDKFPRAWKLASGGPGKGQMFQKVCLLQLQEYILEVLKGALVFQETSPMSSPDDLYSATTKALSRIPEDFFLREWKKKGLDTGPGRAQWLEQLERVVTADGKNLGKFWLFKD